MDENIEVVPSEDNGNVPVESPSEQPQGAAVVDPISTPVDNVEDNGTPAQPAEPEAELFELPDGRKVDGETLAKEWKENFYPEYTRKSQVLADLEKGKQIINPTPDKPYTDPSWQPQSWQEAIELAKQEALQEIESKEKAKIEQQQAVENAVVTQINEIKALEPNLNENALFLHANKYGFRDLKAAHQNMKDMSELAKKVQTTTATNIAKRNDPVSTSPGATGAKLDPSHFSSAVEYLRALKGT